MKNLTKIVLLIAFVSYSVSASRCMRKCKIQEKKNDPSAPDSAIW